MKRYIIAADAARARIFSQARNGDVQEIDTLLHAESREHPGDLRTGGSGGVDDSAGQGIRQSDKSVTTMQNEALAFAKEVAEYMRTARTQGKAEEFVIFSAPKFLGALREKLDAPTQKLIAKTVDKDVSRDSPEAIAERLREF
ncbi:MAG: host attachment protein [Halomonas sp.]|nr:host attachment protein [Halomonas sp.]